MLNSPSYKLKIFQKILGVITFASLVSCSEGGKISENSPFIDPDLRPKFLSNTQTGSFVLFSSQYERLSSPIDDAWTRTKEGGLVYVAAGWDGGVQDQAGKWDYGWYEPKAEEVVTRQSYGKQWAHDSELDINDTIYINVKAPEGGSLNVSGTDTLVVQMGNGAQDQETNTHNNFTITLNGGVQNTSDYSWSNVCSTDQKVSSTHQFGLSTYYLNLATFDCSFGNLEDLKEKVAEVVIKVLGGKNPEQDLSTKFNHTMPSVGFIGFVKSDAIGSQEPSPYVLFASQYKLVEGTSEEPFIVSREGGEVKGFSAGKFTYADYGVTHNGPGTETAQSYGAIYRHTEPVDKDDFFGWSIKGPGNGEVDVSLTEKLVIQLGNAQAAKGEFAASNSHMVFTIELKNKDVKTCTTDLELLEASRPGQEGANHYGLQTYYIPLTKFAGCKLQKVEEVAIKVIGGKDSTASVSTDGNETFPVFGFIGFTK